MGNEKTQDQIKTLSNEVEKEINREVDEKVMNLMKSPINKIDKDAIYQQVRSEKAGSFQKWIDKELDVCDLFYDQLQMDDPVLYKKIIQSITEKVDLSDPSKLTQQLVDKSDALFDHDDVEELKKRALDLFLKENWKIANTYLSFLTLVDVNNPRVWVLKGMSDHNLGQFEPAMISYAKAIYLSPEYVFAHIQMMKTLIASHREKEAKLYYDMFIEDISSDLYAKDQELVAELNVIKNALATAK